MKTAIEGAVNRCTSNFRANMEKDLTGIMDRQARQSNRWLASHIYSEMAKKYNWLELHVLVYNDLNGGDKHWLATYGGVFKFHHPAYQRKNSAIHLIDLVILRSFIPDG